MKCSFLRSIFLFTGLIHEDEFSIFIWHFHGANLIFPGKENQCLNSVTVLKVIKSTEQSTSMPQPFKTLPLTSQYFNFSLKKKSKWHICHSGLEKQQGVCQTCPLLHQEEPHYGQSRTDLQMPGNSHNLTSKVAEMTVKRRGRKVIPKCIQLQILEARLRQSSNYFKTDSPTTEGCSRSAIC